MLVGTKTAMVELEKDYIAGESGQLIHGCVTLKTVTRT